VTRLPFFAALGAGSAAAFDGAYDEYDEYEVDDDDDDDGAYDDDRPPEEGVGFANAGTAGIRPPDEGPLAAAPGTTICCPG
jgi:hypothetical protein